MCATERSYPKVSVDQILKRYLEYRLCRQILTLIIFPESGPDQGLHCLPPIQQFLDTSADNFSKCQWIFTKLGVCIKIVEIWFGIVNGQISSIFDRVICPQYVPIFISG